MQVKAKRTTKHKAFRLPGPDDILRVRRGVEQAGRAIFEIERLYGYRPWKSDYDPAFNFKEPGLLNEALASIRQAQDRLTDAQQRRRGGSNRRDISCGLSLSWS